MSISNTTIPVIQISDVLMPVTFVSVWLALRRAETTAGAGLAFAAALVFALAWGLAWTWHPGLVRLRLLPPPAGQAMAILGAVSGFASLLFFSNVRQFFQTASLEWLVSLGVWRAIYGSILLWLGLMAALPPAFFWSAALGDIFIGLWAITILLRGLRPSRRELLGWNIMGLIDLAHVLALGAINLRPFYLDNPDIAPLNLLPLVGVPVFLALHGMSLWGLLSRQPSQNPVRQS